MLPTPLLWVTTKTPWPPIDGGRRLVVETLRALRDHGYAITLVAPALGGRTEIARAEGPLRDICRPVLVPVRARGRLRSFFAARLTGLPITLARHRHPEVRVAVWREAAAMPVPVVVAEQLQAVWAAAGAEAPVVLRAQNVESDLWAGWAGHGGGRWAASVRAEAERLRVAEAATVRRAAATIAITARDAIRFRELGGEAAVVAEVPAPFPARLPPGDVILAGTPAVVIFGSSGWMPNLDQVRWFLEAVWPVVQAKLPAARLHVFGDDPGSWATRDQGVIMHAPPADSREAFAPHSVLAVPLRLGSGVRIKILEAWARGVPVVATPEAAAGLEATDGSELLLASDGEQFAMALARLVQDPGTGAELVANGRDLLRRRHAPDLVAARLATVLAAAAEGGRPGFATGDPLR